MQGGSLLLSCRECVPLDDAEAVDPGRSILFTRVTELTCGKLTYNLELGLKKFVGVGWG